MKGARLKILLVDDEEAEHRLIQKLLDGSEEVTYALTWARDYTEAMALWVDEAFDAVIIDYLLGERNGLELLRDMVKSATHVPIILLTGYMDPEMGETSIRRGAEDFIPKQELSASLLDRVIRQSVRRKQIETELRESEARFKELAEFSSAALHNIGNLLNSLNLANDRIEHVLLNSRIPLMSKVGHVIELHGREPAFFVENPKGKLLMENLTALISTIDKERTKNLDEVVSIRKKILMMKESISDQQNVSKQSFGMEEMDPRDLVDEVLELKSASIKHRGIVVKRDFQTEKRIRGHRAKLNHVMVNLVRNSIDAMSGLDRGQAMLRVGTHLTKDGFVAITVQDCGAGIAEEQMDNLFSHGFTTKKDGHGFGLSYCARVMGEQGGEITADSEGRGKGATFTLFFSNKKSDAEPPKTSPS